MLNQPSVDAVNTSQFNASFIRPRYEDYGFYRLPQTIVNMLTNERGPQLPADTLGNTGQRYDTVILFLVDAFGWRFYEQFADRYPFLQHFAQRGVVSKLTAQFPSTTAAHITTIHSGLAPAQSGVYEWYQYEPTLNALIAPLMFSFAGEKARDTLVNAGLSPTAVFPAQTLYQRLAVAGVRSCVLQSVAYARSKPSRHLMHGADIIPYKTLPEALVQLGKRLATQSTPSYYFIYFANIDSLGHDYGPASPEVEAEIDSFLTTLERLLLERLAGKRQRTLFMLTADHGQVEIDPATTIYLNVDEGLRGIRRHLALDRNGNPIVPAGSTRDLFLHVKPDALDATQRTLAERLDGRAYVEQTQSLIDQGFFGPSHLPVSSAFLRRVGNLVILPYKGESVYWYERGKFEQTFYGHHGGLTREEMEIPLLVCDL